jgi:hypothetical protein
MIVSSALLTKSAEVTELYRRNYQLGHVQAVGLRICVAKPVIFSHLPSYVSTAVKPVNNTVSFHGS